MARGTRNELNLYEEAKAGLFSLIQQTVAVFLGFVLMLVITGGAPSGFVIALGFCLGTAFVSWSEQKRVRNLKAVDPYITPKEPEPKSTVTQKRLPRNSSTLDIQNLDHQRLLDKLAILERELASTASPREKYVLHKQIEILTCEILTLGILTYEIENLLERVRLGREGNYVFGAINQDIIVKSASQNKAFIQLDPRMTLAEAAVEIQQLLKQLEQTNPTATESEKISYVNDETTPSFKRRAVSALQASGEAAIEEFLDNLYVNLGKAIVKGWMKPE